MPRHKHNLPLLKWAFLAVAGFALFLWLQPSTTLALLRDRHRDKHAPPHAPEILAKCRGLALKPNSATESLTRRSRSDRFEEGTRPVLIRNGKIWTGRNNGTEVLRSDILIDNGLIKTIGKLGSWLNESYDGRLIEIDAQDAWITPGLVDGHSHIGNAPSPQLEGAIDDNSLKGTIHPWLRALDGLNTHDESYLLSISGGVTTSLVLPGSAAAIGGQAYVVKLRETSEKSSSSMLLEPPYHINQSFPNPNLPPRWRHMKHACGENPMAEDTFHDVRMDTVWAMRQAYNTASQIKKRQDEFCESAFKGRWKELGEFPEVLQWESLVDVLRGRVKVNVHCYASVDIDAMVRLSNEFQFEIAAFHHASEAYLIPERIKEAYGTTPALALFATAGRYKLEAYRTSEFAPRILASHGLKVVMKSDHPFINSRYLLHEAQQAYFYGLPPNLAIASVTTAPAEMVGMDHRIGYIKEGYDADLVIWDSHPLALGATPIQVLIDGIPQLPSGIVVDKPGNFQLTPKVPNFDKEAEMAVQYDGLPPLEPSRPDWAEYAFFTNVSTVYHADSSVVQHVKLETPGNAVFHRGSMVCSGACSEFSQLATEGIVEFVDLEGGSINLGLVSFGSQLGLQTIDQEPSTNDGLVLDPLVQQPIDIMGGDTSIIRAVDGLIFGTRDALLAYRAGVTYAITAPSHDTFFMGLATAFRLGSLSRLHKGSIVQEVTAVHMAIGHFPGHSVSSQIAVLRRMLHFPTEGEMGHWFDQVKQGRIPLVVETHEADIIATLIILKKETDASLQRNIRMTIAGGAEAHLLARELAEAEIGVILNPPRPFPYTWESRRILPGPPITHSTAVTELLAHNVLVGLGCERIWFARNLPFEVTWVAIDNGNRLSKEEALALGSTNMRRLLGLDIADHDWDLVATRGGDLLDQDAKVVAIISAQRASVDFL